MKRTEFISYEEVEGIMLPVKTKTYTPISNKQIIDLIYEQGDKNGLIPVNSSYKVAKGGNMLIGNVDFQGSNGELGIRACFRNSYDKSASFAFALGSLAFICSNGMVSGEITSKRVHKSNADNDVNLRIQEGFNKAGEVYLQMINDASKMKEISINPKTNAELLGRMFFEEEIITSQQLNLIKEHYTKPELSAFKRLNNDEYSLWDLYNHTTEALKLTHPSDYIQKHIDLHQFTKQEFQF
jgi:hypothetical protein